MNLKLILQFFIIVCCASIARSQVNIDSVKVELKSLQDQLTNKANEISSQESELDSLKLSISVTSDPSLLSEIQDKISVIQTSYEDLKKLCDIATSTLVYYKNKGVDEVIMNEAYTFDCEAHLSKLDDSVSNDTGVVTYSYYGDNQVIAEDVLNDKLKESQVFQYILGKESKNYLGDIIIPKDKEEFYYYKCIHPGKWFKSGDKDFVIDTGRTFKFDKLDVEIKEGIISDLRVFVLDGNGNTHVFENKIGLSLQRFSTFAQRRFLYYKYSLINGKQEDLEIYKELYIKLSDVFVYNYKIGRNYIPQDLALEFPQEIDGVKNNITSKAKYEIKEDTEIDKVVELRTYTDFLGLFGDSENGLVQIEGKAKFYLIPFPLKIFGQSELQILSSYFPYVNYSRLDKDDRYFIAENESVDNIENTLGNKLNIIEKNFLDMGLDVSLFKIKPSKNYPFYLEIFSPFGYQLTEAKLSADSEDDAEKVKAFYYGAGARIISKRYSNFGLNFAFSFKKYEYNNFNKLPEDYFNMPGNYWVRSAEAEVFYHPNEQKDSAIFIRLRTFNTANTANDEAFYQFQFGYKFSIGNRVKDNK